MVDTTPVGIGQVNSTGTRSALWLKVWAGEVLASFRKRTVVSPLVRTRVISSGKSAQFPVVGRALTAYHVPGDSILDPANLDLQLINHNEKVITLDDKLISATFVDDLEEAKTHWDVRRELTNELGNAMAVELDSRLLRLLVLTARNTTPNVADTGYPAGFTILEATFNTNGANALSALFASAQHMDENELPDGDRFAAIKPGAYYNLIQDQSLLNRDFGGQNGIFSDGTVFKAAGIQLVKTNLLPTSNFSADAGEGNPTTGNFTTTESVVWHRSAVGTVQLQGLSMESERLIEYQGTLMLARMASGHGELRPEAAIEIDNA